jgi:hypothetical protein
MRRLLLVAALIALMSLPVAAQSPKSYSCEVANVYGLSDSGVLQPSVGLGRTGDRFQINVRTGEMTGSPVFSSSHWARTTVLDSGTSPGGSFLKMMYSSPSSNGEFMIVGYLVIQGTIEDPSRPFLFQVAAELYSGVCSGTF